MGTIRSKGSIRLNHLVGCWIEASKHGGVAGDCPLGRGNGLIKYCGLFSKCVEIRGNGASSSTAAVSIGAKPVSTLGIQNDKNNIWSTHEMDDFLREPANGTACRFVVNC